MVVSSLHADLVRSGASRLRACTHPTAQSAYFNVPWDALSSDGREPDRTIAYIITVNNQVF